MSTTYYSYSEKYFHPGLERRETIEWCFVFPGGLRSELLRRLHFTVSRIDVT
jgi:hypothetical protein